ncbi:hypothetical protein QBC32DRAFT_368701 [Pseudoneurospora amorphoporcata]|uniref:Uncharacterized protein n=1 Tax=Pseudoneurospora amorphoporcata TaxID=241081 RepID=A0AAN6SIC3_9PEZI|nr:hypothetical protein QBC32DRAFT_368701 [Pseudoneurospora amorphoporcata]
MPRLSGRVCDPLLFSKSYTASLRTASPTHTIQHPTTSILFFSTTKPFRYPFSPRGTFKSPPPSNTNKTASTKPIIATILFSLAAASAGAVVYFRPGIGRDIGASNMSDKLVPKNPDEVMVIRDVTPNVVTFSVPFLRFGKIPIGGRGTLVKLSNGSLAVFSPVSLTPSALAKISTIGTGQVAYIIATDTEHHIFISEWAKAFPSAKIVGPEGLPEKRSKVTNDERIGHEPFSVVFTKENKSSIKIDDAFDADFGYEYVDAHPNKELVFYYKPDKVLIEADLMFNLPAVEQYSKVPDEQKPQGGLLGRIFTGMNSTGGEAKGIKRFLWYAISRGDRTGFNESVRRIREWGFETIVPCHGETIVGNGKEVYDKVFEWHLVGHK